MNGKLGFLGYLGFSIPRREKLSKVNSTYL